MGSANKNLSDKERVAESLRLAKAFKRVDDPDERRKILEMTEVAASKADRLKSP